MATLRDVAKLAGVSAATVSHVINNTRRTLPETRERVQRAIEQVGFTPRPAGRSLALHRSRRPGVLTGWKCRAGITDEPLAHPPGLTPHRLLRLVRAAQPISRAELARRFGLNRSTVTDVVKPLLGTGVLCEGPTPAEAAPTGRPPVGLQIRESGRAVAGVHIGVLRTRVRLATLGGSTLGELQFETPPRPDEALARVKAALRRLDAEADGYDLGAVGVGVPGPTCVERRTLLYAPHLGWEDVRVAEGLRAATFGARVIVENDATAAASYEIHRRLRRKAEEASGDFVLVWVDVGIGVGVVLDGEVYRGAMGCGGLAGEFGHMIIVAGGKPCVCGGRGCWENYADLRAATSLYEGASAGEQAPTYVELVAKAKAGEPGARAALEKLGEYLGIGISNVVCGLGVPRVVVGGAVVRGWEVIAGPLQETFRRTMAGRLSHAVVESGGAASGIDGALETAADEYLKTLACEGRSH
jgi:predicted NBD/HSP70 family sugar kinase